MHHPACHVIGAAGCWFFRELDGLTREDFDLEVSARGADPCGTAFANGLFGFISQWWVSVVLFCGESFYCIDYTNFLWHDLLYFLFWLLHGRDGPQWALVQLLDLLNGLGFRLRR